MTFNVTLQAAYDVPVTIHYATAEGTATAGSDYTAVSGTVTFAAGRDAPDHRDRGERRPAGRG